MGNELRDVVDAIPALIWTTRPDGDADFFNQRWREYTGLSLDEARGSGWQAAICSTDLPGVLDYIRARQETGEAGTIEARMRRFDGTHRWFLMHCSPLRDASGAIVGWCWYVSQTELDERKRTETLLAGEKQVLEMVARGRPLPAILEAVCTVVEAAAPRCYCSILLINPFGTRSAPGEWPTFQTGAAPTLPPGYVAALEGNSVRAKGGPCGMAASLNTQVIVSDVASETRWGGADGWPALA